MNHGVERIIVVATITFLFCLCVVLGGFVPSCTLGAALSPHEALPRVQFVLLRAFYYLCRPCSPRFFPRWFVSCSLFFVCANDAPTILFRTF